MNALCCWCDAPAIWTITDDGWSDYLCAGHYSTYRMSYGPLAVAS